MRKNTDQKNSEYVHFLRSGSFRRVDILRVLVKSNYTFSENCFPVIKKQFEIAV